MEDLGFEGFTVAPRHILRPGYAILRIGLPWAQEAKADASL